jgi:hypothetical protein
MSYNFNRNIFNTWVNYDKNLIFFPLLYEEYPSEMGGIQCNHYDKKDR